jgi:hypothetical protein
MTQHSRNRFADSTKESKLGTLLDCALAVAKLLETVAAGIKQTARWDLQNDPFQL